MSESAAKKAWRAFQKDLDEYIASWKAGMEREIIKTLGEKPIVLLGPPGSGKGTQAKLLAKKIKMHHIDAGDLLGTEARPNRRNSIIARRLHELDTDRLVFDGYPRELSEAKALDRLKKIGLVIVLELSDKEAIRRLLARGRKDDTEDAIRERLKVFHRETAKVIKHYGKRVRKVDASGSIREVHDEIMKSLWPKE